MSHSLSTRGVVTITALALVGSIVAYAAYFDYKRRNDPSFRKKLRKEKKRAERVKPDAGDVATPGGGARRIEDLQEALQKIREEPLPTSVDEKEQYFMDSVSMGEQLCAQGPAFEFPAALAFYRALRVYPSPVELIMILQKSIPESVFKLVVEMTSLDAAKRVEGYYDHFPESVFNVKVTQVPLNEPQVINGKPVKKSILVADKDFAPGDVIYKEHPIVMALDIDIEGKGSNCSQCFRQISGPLAIRPPSDALSPTYCSKECQLQASVQHHALLFGSNPPVVVDASQAVAIDPTKVEARKAAQATLVERINSSGKAGLLLVARFIGRMVSDETKKLTASTSGSAKPPGDDYSIFDHIERLRYLEIDESDVSKDNEALGEVLKLSAEGLEEFLKNGRYAMLLGKMAYNAIGVTFSGGRDDKPESPLPVEEREWSRTPYSTKRQIGSGLYFVSSYMSHSCSPSVRPSFPTGTNELHLIANQKISKGDELTMAYVDVKAAPDASVIDARRVRRQELARGWKFACACTRCQAEAPELSLAGATQEAPKDDVQVVGRGAQVEGAVERFELGPEHRSKAEASDVE